MILLLACVPHLTTEGGGEPAKWESPGENSWPAGEVPNGTTAEGCGVGQVLDELVGVDQYGQRVSTWQFYGKTTLIDNSTIWCGPCQELASEVEATWQDYKDEEFMYVTVISEDLEGAYPDQEDVAGWADYFTITSPVIADASDWDMTCNPDGSFPQITLVGPDLRVINPEVAANDPAIRAALDAALGL